MDWTAVALTLRLAACTTLALALLGIPLAWWLATTRHPARAVVDAFAALPLILPPTVLGLFVLLALGPNSPLGRLLEQATGSPLPFTFTGILIASIIYNAPFAVRPFAAAFAQIDRRYLEASWCLGVSRRATFFRLALPLARPGIVTGLILTFAHTIGEFGVVLMVGGNIPGETRVISIAIYDHVESLDYGMAHRLSAVLLLFAFTTLIALYAINRRWRHD